MDRCAYNSVPRGQMVYGGPRILAGSRKSIGKVTLGYMYTLWLGVQIPV